MPKFIHDRADHILSKNPDMPKSMAFALATQQSHALGKSPKGYGTEEGRSVAKGKYPHPKSYKKTASLESDIRQALGEEIKTISDHPTPAGYMKQKAKGLMPHVISDKLSKIGTVCLRSFSEELIAPDEKKAEVIINPSSRTSKFLSGIRHEAGPALGATLGAGVANAYGVSPLAGAAAGYGLGALPDIIYSLRNKVAEFGGPGPMELPEDHSAGVSVPQGGSSCANCKYAQVLEDGPHCTNEYYQQWAGTSELIDPATGERVTDPSTYCSNWWEQGEPAAVKEGAIGLRRAGELLTGSGVKRLERARSRLGDAAQSAVGKSMQGRASPGSYDRHRRAVRRVSGLIGAERTAVGTARKNLAIAGAGTVAGTGGVAAAASEKKAAENKSDAELKEVGRQRAVTNLSAEAHREAGRRGERFGQSVGGATGALAGALAGKRLLKGRTGAIAGLATGYMAGSRAGKEIGTERDINKNAFAYSSYGGQPAQNPPGKRMASSLPSFTAPPLEVKEGALGRVLSIITKQAGTKFEDQISGGLADKKKPSQFDKGQISKGVKHELEHTNRSSIAREISMDHLVEDPKYYDKLDKIEEKKAGAGVGSGFSTSQYSGPLSYGPFKMTSGIPPFTAPAMTKADPRAGGESAWMVGADKLGAPASPGTTGQALTPAGNLRLTQQVGAPKISPLGGPSISEISKPQGFGMPLAGTTKI